MYGYHLIKFVIIIQEKTDCILSPHKRYDRMCSLPKSYQQAFLSALCLSKVYETVVFLLRTTNTKDTLRARFRLHTKRKK